MQLQLFHDLNYIVSIGFDSVGYLFHATNGWHTTTFEIPSGITYNNIRIKRDGLTRDIDVYFDMILPPGIYTIGMEIFSDDASVVGGFEFGNIVIVEGDVALTQYIPYKQYVELPSVLGICTLCPPNTYKDFVGNAACTPCPNRTMSPAGAISVEQCGHVLHIDDYIVFMPVGKRTEHGLCTMLDGKKYCADVYEK